MLYGKKEQPRDFEGWRIPREGTVSRRIYEMAVDGLSPREMAEELPDTPVGSIRVLLWKIRRPEAANAYNNAYARRRRALMMKDRQGDEQMHTGPVPGNYSSQWKPVVMAGFVCRKCGGALEYREWESSCGGYEDQQFRCTACGNSWWVEGPDA